MTSTVFLAKLIGPVLLLRGLSVLVDRKHFVAILSQLEAETKTISFSMVPVFLLMAAISVTPTHSDTSSVAGILIHLTAWGMMAKSTLLIVWPSMVVQKAQLLGQAGFLSVVMITCWLMGAYLSWVGYFA